MRLFVLSLSVLFAVAGPVLAQKPAKPLDLTAQSFRAPPPVPLPSTIPLPLPRPDSAPHAAAADADEEENEADAEEAERLATAPLPVPSPFRMAGVSSPVPTVFVSPQPAGPQAAVQGVKPGMLDQAEQVPQSYAALPDASGRDWPRMLPNTPGGETLGAGLAQVNGDPGAPLRCLPKEVKDALVAVAARFGPVIVRSTQRQWRPGARRHSMHLQCRAADIRVMNGASVLAYLRSRPDLGGVKRYSNGIIHLDNGPKRSW